MAGEPEGGKQRGPYEEQDTQAPSPTRSRCRGNPLGNQSRTDVQAQACGYQGCPGNRQDQTDPEGHEGLQSPRSPSQTLEGLSEKRGDTVMADTCVVQDSGLLPHVAIESLIYGWSQWRCVGAGGAR